LQSLKDNNAISRPMLYFNAINFKSFQQA